MLIFFFLVTKCQKCQALEDFSYHDDDNYLQIEKGDIIDIIDIGESDWILGQKGNIKGLVPKSHVHLLKNQHGKNTILHEHFISLMCVTGVYYLKCIPSHDNCTIGVWL